MSLPVLVLVLSLLAGASSAVPYSDYILAPSSRTVRPVITRFVNGSVTNVASLLNSTSLNPSSKPTIFNGTSGVTFDFGINIAGIASVTTGNSSSGSVIGLTFTESSLWISNQASDAQSDAGLDEPVWFAVGDGGPGTYTVESQKERGGFRYLSVFSNNASGIVEVTGVEVRYTASPDQDLRDYKGWFHSSDELLNRIWYAGAYTNQMCTIDPTKGDSLAYGQSHNISSSNPILLPETVGWYNNYTITNGTSASTDGARRDRLVWPGDIAVSLPAIFVSTNDMISIKNSLDSLLVLQHADGMLPYAGVPFTLLRKRYTGDLAYLQSVWGQFKKGMQWSLSYVDDSGLMNVTSPSDWLRVGMGGHNIEANAILYYTLNQAVDLANILNDSSPIQNWTSTASTVKTAAYNLLWNATTGLYHDNETTLVSPQDGNVWAIISNLTLSTSQAQTISSSLQARWGTYGAPAPEVGNPGAATVSPFISGFELEAHYLSGSPERALALLRKAWRFMLDDERMTGSTFIEGYSINGTLDYAPYANDARVSHAHGWSTAPTYLLTFYAAGIHLTSANGKTWQISPQPGDLTAVDAGFVTALGNFSTSYKTSGVNGTITEMNITTPVDTWGSVSLPGVKGSLVSMGNTTSMVSLMDGAASGLQGGDWKLVAY